MANAATKKNLVNISVDASELSPTQIRLLKSLNAMIKHVMTTDSESDFFDGSAECMRICASLIKQARFIEAFKAEDIPYAEQALEYSIDILQEQMSAQKVVSWDN
ncbi:MAG: hypothetical protein CME71_02225 [Halobacteriovorax sp.]|nr:hypothetical protein [Halobacteriovorax sp.]|tara:strand:- start:3379 stop:3693 length:315 start_codon:yes stop_codon:yes gene_type:complete